MTQLIIEGIGETLYMTAVSTFLAYLFGLPLGILLVLTGKGGIKPMPTLNLIVGFVVNVFRSIPFLILLVAVIPVTRAIVGTILGSTAAIVPLVISATPFIARIVESSLIEVDAGVIEAAQSMGANTRQIVMKVMLPEAKPSIITNAALASVTILGYSAMAGYVGGGGLGDIAMRYGFYKFDTATMWVVVVIIVVIVQIMQEIGLRIAKHTDHRAR
ncbi:MAG: ABC transporter permease [Firmicutes bacterium]|nr:ABC transporter permease [Clostridiales bacterium]MBQ3122746.1 ABC transporter permease [Bacillota bacterium]